MSTWLKKVERIENNAKRRAKDAKTREFFEKVFPELKKQREDKERLQRYPIFSLAAVNARKQSN